MNRTTETKTFTDGELSSVAVTSDTPAPDFIQLARDVKQIRENLEWLKGQVTTATSDLEKTPEFKIVADLIDLKSRTQATLADAETRLREAAITQYNATKEKKFVGVSVRINRRVEYDRTEALGFVSQLLPSLLSFDEKQFDRYALAVADAGQPINFVTVREEPTAAIATKIEV